MILILLLTKKLKIYLHVCNLSAHISKLFNNLLAQKKVIYIPSKKRHPCKKIRMSFLISLPNCFYQHKKSLDKQQNYLRNSASCLYSAISFSDKSFGITIFILIFKLPLPPSFLGSPSPFRRSI